MDTRVTSQVTSQIQSDVPFASPFKSVPIAKGPDYFPPEVLASVKPGGRFPDGPVCRERELKFWTLGLVDLADTP